MKDMLDQGDWKIVEKQLCGKPHYLVMKKHYDAPNPYFLTERVFRTFSGARNFLKNILEERS